MRGDSIWLSVFSYRSPANKSNHYDKENACFFNEENTNRRIIADSQ